MTGQQPKKPAPPPMPPLKSTGLSREDLKLVDAALAKLETINEELVAIRKEVLHTRKSIRDQVAYGILLAFLAMFILWVALQIMSLPR